jgi:hypothetical protein
MSDLIDRAKLMDNADALAVADAEALRAEILREIMDAPAEDAEIVRHGYWKTVRAGDYGSERMVCSACESEYIFQSKYCPECGAKMQKEDA